MCSEHVVVLSGFQKHYMIYAFEKFRPGLKSKIESKSEIYTGNGKNHKSRLTLKKLYAKNDSQYIACGWDEKNVAVQALLSEARWNIRFRAVVTLV